MEIFLVRHTSVAVPQGTCYGRADVGLAETFLAEAAAVRTKLPPQMGEVYTSPLSRCVRLAEQLTTQPLTDSRLQEYDFGEWEMMLWDEIRGPAAAPWFADYVHTPAPGGESYVQMAERVVAWWEEVLLSKSELIKRPVVVVTHAGVIRALLAHLLQMSLKQAFNLTIDWGGVTQLTVYETHVQVDYINR